MKIVLDAMGGDHAPGVVIDGAVMAAREYEVEILLVGGEKVVQAELDRHDTTGLKLSIVHASQVVEMEEHTEAVKRKPDSSMVVGIKLVRDGQADAFVSAGNSGAVMAAAILRGIGIGRIRGIRRPALATYYPAASTPVFLLDVGAQTDCRTEYLLQFAQMGAIYAERVMGIPNPRVGIVSNGEEADKGNMLVRDTYTLLEASGLNFVGNVEGKDVTKGMADVVVTDGFTGNVMVKLTEGLVSFLAKYFKGALTDSGLNKLALALMVPGLVLTLPGLLLLIPTVKRVARRMDYAEYGGAPLLGVDGVVVIAHGRSNAKAIKNAIRQAKQAVEGNMIAAIKEGLASGSWQTDARD
jgi:glycerol-3-phosphate acyltransferase PlsX